LLIALIAPELLLLLAINQSFDAHVLETIAATYLQSQPMAKPRTLAHGFKSILRRAKAHAVSTSNKLRIVVVTHRTWKEMYPLVDQATPLRKYPFGLAHAFYVVMGGFKIEGYSNGNTPTAGESPSTSSTDSCFTVDVLNFRSFVYIMKHFPEIIPDIPEESITDRAESSSLSKALLIVQVGWFCMNGASRLIQGLPLSLLEVSTAAHAFSTLLVYLVWWSKPLNIAEGKRIKGQKAWEVHALLECSPDEYRAALILAKRIAVGESPIPTDSNERVTLAANALKHLLPTPEAFISRPFRMHNFSSPPGSWSIKSNSHEYYERMTLAISPILYGLVHFLAQSDQFPTPLEHLLWRISSLMVLCSGLTAVTSLVMAEYLSDVKPKGATTMSMMINVLDWTLIALAALVIPFAHVLASGFLVVESFRQLFFLEPAVYQVPSWSEYWPHLS
jgi:hypothetical protein